MTAGELLRLYEQMEVIRRTEQAAHDLFLAGLVKGTTHLAAGHEAVAVGASAALRPDDYVFATYRGHHHAIARGASPGECLAELMSKATGVCRAKGGSMHLTKASAGMLGSYAIVGAHLPMAAGAAWSAQLRGTGQVAGAFFGDGATNIGAFPHPAADRAASYGLAPQVIDGNDVTAVAAAVGQAADRARAGAGPALLEAVTYRHFGHSRTDPAKYRPAEEVEQWLRRDPLTVARGLLAAAGATPQTVDAAAERARQVVAAAVEEARRAPAADPGQALTDVWADGGAAWRT